MSQNSKKECSEKEDVSKAAERSGREELRVSIQFSEMDIIEDINGSNFVGVRGSKATLR